MKLYFSETQKFNQLWFKIVIFGAILISISSFIIMFFKDLNRPIEYYLLNGAIVLVTSFFIIFLFLKMRLLTEVRENGCYFKFSPFHRKFRKIENYISFEKIEYRPIREYGGWGIRKGRNGWCYNVSGNTGVLFKFSDGKTLLIGTQKGDEFIKSLEKL